MSNHLNTYKALKSILHANACMFRLLSSLTMGLFLFLFSSCTDEYWPDLGSKYERLLVIEGLITDSPGPYTVKLSYSSSVDDPQYFPATGFDIRIWDDAGNNEQLLEEIPGTYNSSAEGIRGTAGRKYKITLTSPDDKYYESGYELLNSPVGIDSIYAVLEYRPRDYYPFDMPGYQFYIDTKPAAEDSVSFLWQLTQTYKYSSDFKVFYYYDGTLHEVIDEDSLYYCWKTDPVYSIFTASTAGLAEPVIQGFPFHFVGFDTREFSERYSLMVKQLAISKQTSDFWKAVDELNSSTDGLYTRLPYQIRGNVYRTGDSDEPVLGYFMVAGLSEKRLFYYPPPPPAKMYYYTCVLQDVDYEEYGWMFVTNDPREWPKLVTRDPNGYRAVPNPLCIDCRWSGGTVVKPEFWID